MEMRPKGWNRRICFVAYKNWDNAIYAETALW